MLDYAANGVRYWPVETLRARLEASCAAQNPPQDPTEALTHLHYVIGLDLWTPRSAVRDAEDQASVR